MDTASPVRTAYHSVCRNVQVFIPFAIDEADLYTEVSAALNQQLQELETLPQRINSQHDGAIDKFRNQIPGIC